MDMRGQKVRWLRLSRKSGFTLRFALGLLLMGLVFALQIRTTNGATGTESAAKFPVPSTMVCITDDVTHDNLQFSFPAGTYTFKHLGTNPITLSGTGVARNTGVFLLTDTKPDRNVVAGFIPGQGTGRATVSVRVSQGVVRTFTIIQNIPNAPCGGGS